MNAIQLFIPSHYDTLDKLANGVETLLWRCALPGQVRGGFIHPGCIQMSVAWQCNPMQPAKCTQLNAEIWRVFSCYGGVDANTLDIFLQANKPLYGGER